MKKKTWLIIGGLVLCVLVGIIVHSAVQYHRETALEQAKAMADALTMESDEAEQNFPSAEAFEEAKRAYIVDVLGSYLVAEGGEIGQDIRITQGYERVGTYEQSSRNYFVMDGENLVAELYVGYSEKNEDFISGFMFQDDPWIEGILRSQEPFAVVVCGECGYLVTETEVFKSSGPVSVVEDGAVLSRMELGEVRPRAEAEELLGALNDDLPLVKPVFTPLDRGSLLDAAE